MYLHCFFKTGDKGLIPFHADRMTSWWTVLSTGPSTWANWCSGLKEETPDRRDFGMLMRQDSLNSIDYYIYYTSGSWPLHSLSNNNFATNNHTFSSSLESSVSMSWGSSFPAPGGASQSSQRTGWRCNETSLTWYGLQNVIITQSSEQIVLQTTMNPTIEPFHRNQSLSLCLPLRIRWTFNDRRAFMMADMTIIIIIITIIIHAPWVRNWLGWPARISRDNVEISASNKSQRSTTSQLEIPEIHQNPGLSFGFKYTIHHNSIQICLEFVLRLRYHHAHGTSWKDVFIPWLEKIWRENIQHIPFITEFFGAIMDPTQFISFSRRPHWPHHSEKRPHAPGAKSCFDSRSGGWGCKKNRKAIIDMKNVHTLKIVSHLPFESIPGRISVPHMSTISLYPSYPSIAIPAVPTLATKGRLSISGAASTGIIDCGASNAASWPAFKSCTM